MSDEYLPLTWVSDAGIKLFEELSRPVRMGKTVSTFHGASKGRQLGFTLTHIAQWGTAPLEQLIIDSGLIDWRSERDLYPPSIAKEVWERICSRTPAPVHHDINLKPSAITRRLWGQ